MDNPIWQTQFGDDPLVATAIHDGDEIRPELHPFLAIAPADRLREQDPYTGMWTSIASTRIVGLRSRFEVDLNRPRHKSVYLAPEDSWGLTVWNQELPTEVAERSLALHDYFYAHLHEVLSRLILKHGRIVILDLHSYNHRRSGMEGPEDDPERNPEINIGTGTMDRDRWAPIVDRCISELRNFRYQERYLDVRENVKFLGGNLSKWVHETFPESACSISIEVKKFFMCEWTGHPDHDHLFLIGQALQQAAAGIRQELGSFEPVRSED